MPDSMEQGAEVERLRAEVAELWSIVASNTGLDLDDLFYIVHTETGGYRLYRTDNPLAGIRIDGQEESFLNYPEEERNRVFEFPTIREALAVWRRVRGGGG